MAPTVALTVVIITAGWLAALSEKCWRIISLYMTDNAIAKLYM